MIAAALLVGSLALHPCDAGSAYYCGRIVRPLDSTLRVAGTVDVAFTWLPHSRQDRPSSGTIVAAEGGPGYPSGGSREAYRVLFGSLLATHDLLMMDDRGTGRSGAIDCPWLQRGWMTPGGIARCGARLGAFAGSYGSADAADDLDALLTSLRIGRVELYGDSYGTFFVQTFTARHPTRVATVVLDGAYPASDLDPWYPSTAPAIASAFDAVCRRATTCAARGASSMARLRTLLRSLRRSRGPIAPWQLAFVMDTAGLDAIAYRELDAAARAWLDGRDATPLRRLAREASQYEETASADPREESNGSFVATSCEDDPQAYDMRLPPNRRRAQWRSVEARVSRTDPQIYGPFTIGEFLQIPLDYAYVPLCLTWPVTLGRPAGRPFAPGTRMPDVPALVLTGDLDTITTPAEGDATAALFRRATRLVVRNTGHVTAIDDPWNCASRIVRAFLAGERSSSECSRRIPAVRVVDAFARRRSDVAPARRTTGSATTERLRDAVDALQAAGDALTRVSQLGATSGIGLRGGTFSSRRGANVDVISLAGVRWTEDYPVSGSIRYDRASGNVVARLRGRALYETATWNARTGTTATLLLHGPAQARALAAAP